MHAHLLSAQSVLDTFDTGFKSTRNRIEIKILVSSQPYGFFTQKDFALYGIHDGQDYGRIMTNLETCI